MFSVVFLIRGLSQMLYSAVTRLNSVQDILFKLRMKLFNFVQKWMWYRYICTCMQHWYQTGGIEIEILKL